MSLLKNNIRSKRHTQKVKVYRLYTGFCRRVSPRVNSSKGHTTLLRFVDPESIYKYRHMQTGIYFRIKDGYVFSLSWLLHLFVYDGIISPGTRYNTVETGIITGDWKSANLTAIHKKGFRQEPGNYRPISLTSVVCKTMERLVKGRLITQLEMNNLIGDSQHGFRNKRSCLTSLLDFYAQIIDTYDTDNNKSVDLVYLDFQKAFDKVPYERLMLKVNAHGIQGDASRWIRNWLAGLRQWICINQSYSNWAPVTSGVRQSSVLGPLLFLIYIYIYI